MWTYNLLAPFFPFPTQCSSLAKKRPGWRHGSRRTSWALSAFVRLLRGTTRAVSQIGKAGGWEGGLELEGAGVDVGGWTRDDWASAVSSVHLHMAQCPTSTMLNDKSPASPSSQTDTPSQTPPSLCLNIYTHTHTVRNHTTAYVHKCAHKTKTCTKHTRRQACSSPAFCIGDTFHYSKLLSGDGVCTSRGDMHSLQTRYTLNYACSDYRHCIFLCPCISVCARSSGWVCSLLACLIVSVNMWVHAHTSC